eukprot:s681_g11.t1
MVWHSYSVAINPWLQAAMAEHLLDAVPRHLRFNRGGSNTRNLLLRNISKGELPLRISDPQPPFSLQIGAEHVGEVTLAPGATLAFRITADLFLSEPELLCQFFTVNIECSPPLLIDLVLASDTASEDEVQRCVAAARPAVTVTAAPAPTPAPAAVPAAAQVGAPQRPPPVPAALAEFLGEEPSSAALRGGPLRYIAATEGVSPPDTPEGSHDERLNFDDRPPTPSPEGAAEMDVAKPPQPAPRPAPRPVPVEVLPVPTVSPMSPMEPVEPLAAVAAPELSAPAPQAASCQMPHAASFEHVSSKLSPAEATRIAALRAKGLLKPDAPVSEVPTTVPPPKPEGFEDHDLFYIEGSGWCDIYGRTVDSLAFASASAAPSSPAKSSRSARSSSTASPARPIGQSRSKAEQQAAWDAIPGI